MSSHIDPGVNTHFLKFLNGKYRKHAKVEATRGSEHEYLGMKLIFKDGKMTVDMV